MKEFIVIVLLGIAGVAALVYLGDGPSCSKVNDCVGVGK